MNLNGTSKAAFPFVPDGILFYLLSLLRDEQPVPPEATMDEWFIFLTHLQDHRMVPLLYWKIGHLPLELRPSKFIICRMRERFLESRAHYQTMENQIREILKAFNREKISVLVLRGPGLASTVYPNSATRPFDDIDLLVRPGKYLRAREILIEMGYQCPFKRFEMFQDFFNADPFYHRTDATKRFEVDLHWDMFQYHGLRRENGIADFFSRTKTVETPTLNFKTLSTVDALIQAGFHLILHHGKGMRLIWVSDIALLAEKLVAPEDWEVLRKRTLEFKTSLAMENALRLAHLWYGLQIPEGYDDFTNWSHEEAEKIELTYVKNKRGPDIRLKGYIQGIRSAPKKFRFLLNFFFPDPQYMHITYPPSRKWLLPLSYVHRWSRWFTKLIKYVFYGLFLRTKNSQEHS